VTLPYSPSSRPTNSLGTWIAVVAAVAIAALGLSIAALVVGLGASDTTESTAGDAPPEQGSADDPGAAADQPVADQPNTAEEASDETVQPTAVAAPELDVRELTGVAIGADGAALAELPTAPTVRIDTFFDFMCPYCAEFEATFGPDLTSLNEAGTIVWVQHPIAILDQLSLGTNYSSRSAAAAYAIANGAPEAYSAFVEGLFAAQPAENTEGLTDEQIVEIAQDAGVPASVTDTFWSTDYVSEMSTVTVNATLAGVTGTPTLMISTPDSAPEKWDYQTPLDQLVALKAGQ
jgi:protein-disulfide isomerase